MEKILDKIEIKKPLIHHITNYVTVNDCANITLYWGGLPVMAHSLNEVEEMVKNSSALVLNIGTIDKMKLEAMIRAGKQANKLNIPVILDPVGAGATDYRTKSSLKLLNELNISVISGNEGEISVLSGQNSKVKGVESVGSYDKILQNSKRLAKKYNSIVVVSGREDIVTNGSKSYKIFNGHPLLKKVVGTGCMLTSTIGVFCGVENNYFEASAAAVMCFGIAGEKASQEAKRPGSFKTLFMDNVSILSKKDIIEREKICEC